MKVTGGIKINDQELQYFLHRGFVPILESITDVSARKIEAKAKAGAPVLTGALRNGIHVEKPRPHFREIMDSVLYGVFQELGTSRIPARGFLTNAAESEADDYFNAIHSVFARF